MSSKKKIKSLCALIGFFFYYSVCICLIVFVLKFKLLPWPFKGTESLAHTYKNICIYIPVFFFALGSTVWLKIADLSIYKGFKWHRITSIFYIALIISVGYSLQMFVTTPFSLRGFEFWPPVFFLSLFNAMSEEIIYRFVFYSLLKNYFKNTNLSNIFQSFAYSMPHYWIGGFLMAVYAFFYGLILGQVVEKNKSVTPAIICHFCIDIGNIGLPLLIKQSFFSSVL